MKHELTKDQAVFLEQIAENYEDMLLRYCAKCMNYNPMLLQFVPDLVQEVYLKAILCVGELMCHNNVPGWLKKSCHFSLLNMLRNQKNSPEVFYPTIEKLQYLLRPEQIMINGDESSVTLEEVIRIVDTILSEEELAIFKDYFLDNQSTIETAQLNNLSYDTVRGKISRIRKKLKKHFYVK